jgi:hypothetical protein
LSYARSSRPDPERLSPRSVPSPAGRSSPKSPESASSLVGPRHPQRVHHRHPRLPRRQPAGPVLLPLQRLEPIERLEVILVHELDPQPGLGQRGDDLAEPASDTSNGRNEQAPARNPARLYNELAR